MLYNPPVGGAANDPYVDGNPGAGIEGSPVPAAAIEYPQREIIAVLAAAGLVPSNGDLTQLAQAIPILSGINNLLKARGTTVASAATTNLGAADSDYVEISGTTTITSLGATTTRNHVWVKFQGALTLTHNGASLILPTAANILTAAGDHAEFVRISGSNWECVNYIRASGQPLVGPATPLGAKGTTIASAATTDVGAADSSHVEISGTTNITSLGASTNRDHVWLEFQGALTLTHNGTSLILPTGANIVTAAGDCAEFVRISGSNWRCLNYLRANGKSLADPLGAKGTTIASASTTDIGAADSSHVEISGTTTITSLGSTTGRNHMWLEFQGALTLTHHATQLILPSGANIVTAAGDCAEFVRTSAGNWRCINYMRASGKALITGIAYGIGNVAMGTFTGTASNATSTFADTGITLNITAQNANSKILLIAGVTASGSSDVPEVMLNLMRGATNLLLGDVNGAQQLCTTATGDAAGVSGNAGMTYLDSPGAGAFTYKVQFAVSSSGTAYINRNGSDNSTNDPRGASSLVAIELLPIT